MKKGMRCRLAFILVLAMIVGMFGISTNIADAKASVVTVKATGTSLLEGFTLTEKMVRKAVRVTENGKTINYAVKKNQIRKPIKPSKKGRKKVSLKVNGITKSVSVKVNYMTDLYLKKTTLVLEENSTSWEKAFRKSSTFMASYQKGKDRVFKNYKIKAAKKVKANKKGLFPVTVSYAGKNGTFKFTVYIKVIKNTVATAAPTQVPTTEDPEESEEPQKSLKPSSVPTTATPTSEPTDNPTEIPTEAPTEKPTEMPTEAPTEAPTEKPTEMPTEAPTEAPTDKPTEVPTQAPTQAPTQVPTETPNNFTNLTIIKNGEGNVTVNNRLCTFSGDTAIEKVAKGTCTVDAGNTSNSKFKQWINTETKEVLSTSSTLTFDTNLISSVTAVFERVQTVTLYRTGGSGKATFNGEVAEFVNNVATFKVVEGRYEFVAISTDDYDFVSATYGNTISNVPTFTVPVTSNDVKITVNFVETEKTVTVTYQHDYGQVLVSQAVAFGESLAPPTENLWQSNKTFAGWQVGDTVYYGSSTDTEFYDENHNSLSDAIKALTQKKQNVTVVSYFVEDTTRYYSVNIEGGEITSSDETITDGKVVDGTRVFIKATTLEGKSFAGWYDADGNIVSYEEEYNFFVHSDISLTAKFSDTAVDKVPVVHFTGNQYELSPSNQGVTFTMAAEIPEGFKKVSWYLLYSSEALSEEKMVYGGDKVTSLPLNSNVEGSSDFTYDLTISKTELWQNESTVQVRMLLYYSDDATGTHSTYSPILRVTLSNQK